MFEQSILKATGGRRKWTIGAAILGELAMVGILILLPLMYVQVIPTPQLVTSLTLPPPPPPPPPPPAPRTVTKIQKTAPRRFNPDQLLAPRAIPKESAPLIAAAEPPLPQAPDPGAVPGGVPGGAPGGVIGGVVGAVPSLAPPPPPPAKPEAAPAPRRIHVGGAVQAAKLIREVQPKFPLLAREARIGGVVRMKAVISKDGHIKDLAVISGHPLLIPSAMNAVKQWIYQPTYLNGQPVEIDTEIDVTFALAT